MDPGPPVALGWISSSYTAHPIFADDYVAFQHEVFLAASYANASMDVVLPFAETFDHQPRLGGTKLTTLKQIIPDVEPVDAFSASSPSNLTYSVFLSELALGRATRAAIVRDATGQRQGPPIWMATSTSE